MSVSRLADSVDVDETVDVDASLVVSCSFPRVDSAASCRFLANFQKAALLGKDREFAEELEDSGEDEAAVVGMLIFTLMA